MNYTISKTIDFVKNQLENAETGHDWWHIERVWKNTLLILKEEKAANSLICELAALLHDIADPKFHDGNDELGPEIAENFILNDLALSGEIAKEVKLIIQNMSFSSSLNKTEYSSLEMDIVQDADRLDAIGAIGIARAFNYGGYKGRELYNPHIPPVYNFSKEEYRNLKGPTINHFYEKLLLLNSLFKTKKGKEMAQKRHSYLEGFLEQFLHEWNAES